MVKVPVIQKYTNIEKLPPGFLPALAAFLGNLLVAFLKWVAFFGSGSSAMFSEAIHSVADVANQALLLLGVQRTKRKPNKEFAYGCGRERFFWALISACGVFFLGAGITVYRGISGFLHPQQVQHDPFAFVVLGIAFFVELGTLWLAHRELKRRHPDYTLREALEEGDPVTVAVFYEDTVAVIGVAVAATAIALSSITGSPYWDAGGALIIGFLLGGIALFLINKNRKYIIGRSMPEEIAEKVTDMLIADPMIESVHDFKSATLDVGVYRVKCEIELNGTALLRELNRKGLLQSEYETIKEGKYDDFLRFCADYADRIPRVIGERINKLEAKIQKALPEVRHIDIEIN